MTVPTPDIARLDMSADELIVALKRVAADRMKRLMVEDQQYDVHHLDADSTAVLPDCQYVSYLPGPAGGQS